MWDEIEDGVYCDCGAIMRDVHSEEEAIIKWNNRVGGE
jgi:hypothetical protein